MGGSSRGSERLLTPPPLPPCGWAKGVGVREVKNIYMLNIKPMNLISLKYELEWDQSLDFCFVFAMIFLAKLKFLVR